MQNYAQGILHILDVLSNKQFKIQAWEGIVILYFLAQDVNLDLAHDNFWFDSPAPDRSINRVGLEGFISRVILQQESDIRVERSL